MHTLSYKLFDLRELGCCHKVAAAIISVGELQITSTVMSDAAYRWQKATEASVVPVKMTFMGLPPSKDFKSPIIVLGCITFILEQNSVILG